MDVFNRLKTIKNKVKHLLITQPELRSDDSLLIARFHYYEIGGDKLGMISSMDLLTMFAKKQVTSASSIDRVRRSLQKDNENLRGDNYEERHKEASSVRSQIRHL